MLTKGAFTRHWKTCALAIHLHNNCILEAWKRKLLKTGLKVQLFENDTIIICLNYKIANLWKWCHHACVYYVFSSVYRYVQVLEECICAQARSVPLKSDVANLRTFSRFCGDYFDSVAICMWKISKTQRKNSHRFFSSKILRVSDFNST